MVWNVSSPLTGAAVAGLTSPTYTLTADQAPDQFGKQHAVTALGGTQTNVEAHTVSKPFTLTFWRPRALKQLPAANPVTGVIKGIGMNSYKVITRKGVVPAAGQSPMVARITTVIEVPAGAETYEPEDIKAMISCHAGSLWSQASGIGDTVVTGIS